jgi:hypothetical protein
MLGSGTGSWSAGDIGLLAGLIVTVVVLGILVYRAMLRARLTTAEIERRRRVRLNQTGKLGDAEIIDLHGDSLVYSYSVRGVGYTASQDISALHEFIPDAGSVGGPALVKYDPRNPANSILLSEEWSGLRGARPRV